MLSGIIARLRSLSYGLLHRRDLELEMREEFRLHQEMRAEDLVRSGLTADEAMRRARVEFGSTEKFKDEARASRGLRSFDEMRISWLDVKLGVRMLVKYPGLTLVGGLAVAFAIAVGASAFQVVTQTVYPTLPFADGGRIVGFRMWDAAASRLEPRTMYDFLTWRSSLRSVQELGAFREVRRNLVTGDARGEWPPTTSTSSKRHCSRDEPSIRVT